MNVAHMALKCLNCRVITVAFELLEPFHCGVRHVKSVGPVHQGVELGKTLWRDTLVTRSAEAKLQVV